MLFTLSLQYNIAITEESAESLALDESGQVNTDLLNEVGTIFVVVVNLWEIMHVGIYFFFRLPASATARATTTSPPRSGPRQETGERLFHRNKIYYLGNYF